MTPRFKPEDRVRVLPEDKPGHVRTPGYIRGKTDLVESVLGEFRNPESFAYGTLAYRNSSLQGLLPPG